jgi:cell division protein FtsL
MMQSVQYAYKQAPWRKQLRLAGFVLVGLVITVMIAIAYLNISAKTYAAGIEIQSMQREKDTISSSIADLRNQLGSVTSLEIMSEKADEEGYKIISDPSRIVFLTVPGYVEPQPKVEAPKGQPESEKPIVKSVYTRSLWDLLMSGALTLENQP